MSLAYYNEIDPYAAQWLRNLIDAGYIAKGYVDERSIEDVRPIDLLGFTQCHFFAGIGVWSYALRLAGWPDNRPVWTSSGEQSFHGKCDKSVQEFGRPGPTNGYWRYADWLRCRDAKWRPIEPGTFPLANGITNRMGRLRAYGNAINAQQAKIFIETVMECMP